MSINIEKKTREVQTRPRLVEIVGPAGAGKTTLCKVLSSCRGVHLSNFPDVRKKSNAHFFIFSGFRVFPVFLQICRSAERRLTRREFAWLSILSGWPKVIRNELKRNEDVLVLDQGPVYLLSEMTLLGHEFLKASRAKPNLQSWYSQWAATLDAIVWLDATNECLINRIRSREKDHVVKDASPQAVIRFLDDYRAEYEHTLSKLIDHRIDLKIFKFDTGRQSPQEIANQLLVELDLKLKTSVDQKC